MSRRVILTNHSAAVSKRAYQPLRLVQFRIPSDGAFPAVLRSRRRSRVVPRRSRVFPASPGKCSHTWCHSFRQLPQILGDG